MKELERRPLATDLLRKHQVVQVRSRSNKWAVWLILHAWVTIFLVSIVAVMIPNPITWVLAILVIGSRQLGLVILMHECAHGSLFRTGWCNRFAGQVFCAWPMLADLLVYRKYHLPHHLNTQTNNDPDLLLTKHYPISRNSMKRKIVRDLTGRTGLNQRTGQIIAAFGDPSLDLVSRVTKFLKEMGPQLCAQLLLFSLAYSLHLAWVYFAFWLLPMLTWHQLVLRIRNIAEHACVGAPEHPFQNTRTTEVSLIERIFIAPYWVNYHLEHHLLMWVPCYRLPLFHRLLADNGHRPRQKIDKGYLSVLKSVTHERGDSESAEGVGRKPLKGTFTSGFKSG
jgi:fatty acid desaturase